MSQEPMPTKSEQETTEPKTAEPKVFWSVLMERSVPGTAVGYLLNIATVAGARGYQKIELPYMRTELARNMIVQAFLDNSEDDNDVLVMLDCDHKHPSTILDMAHYPPEIGVVGALAYRRGGNHDPLFFLRGEDGLLHGAMQWENEGLYRCAAVATCAIAIKRWVFTRLAEAGHRYFFRYEYPDDGKPPTEDMVFARFCEEAGIHHYCDTSLTTPHLIEEEADGRQWQAFLAARRAEIERFPEAPGREELPRLLQEIGATVGAEIGVQKGEFSEHLLANWDGFLYMIDAWEYQETGYVDPANVNHREHGTNLEETLNRSARFPDRHEIIQEYSVEAAALFDDGSLDFVYIDANHAYEAVLADLAAWYPKVRSGGIVAGDDFVDNQHNRFECRVRPAVLDFIKDLNIEVRVERAPWPRLWYFKKP